MADNADTSLAGAGEAAEQKKRTGSAAEPVEDCPLKKKSWVEVELLDEEGKGVADQKYELTLPDGSVITGKTDANGLIAARDFAGSDGDECTVSFVDLDGDVWEFTRSYQP